MAEETPQLRNKGLLLIAVVLGGVVVIIYNVHINKVRTSLEGRRVQLLKFARSMSQGEKIDAKDLVPESIRAEDARALGEVMQVANQRFAIGRRLRESVRQDQWILWSHVTGTARVPSGRISTGMVGIILGLHPRNSPGPLCQPGDRVNIFANLQISPETPPKWIRLIRNVEVLSTGSVSMIGRDRDIDQRTISSYRSIAIEVSDKVSPKLLNLVGMAKGEVVLEVLPPDIEYDPAKHGIINPDEPVLQQLLDTGGVPTR